MQAEARGGSRSARVRSGSGNAAPAARTPRPCSRRSGRSASRPTSLAMTGRPAQGCAVRSCWLHALRGFRRAAGQRYGHHQRRRVGPIAQPEFRLQRYHAIVVATRATAAWSAGCPARDRAARSRPPPAAGRPPPRCPSSPARRRRDASTGGRPRSASGRPGSWSCPARGTVPACRPAPGSALPSPPVTLTVRCEPSGTETVPLSALQEHRRQPRIGGRRDPGLQLGRRRRSRSRQCRLHRLCQPRRRVLAGDAERGDQRHQQGGAQRHADRGEPARTRQRRCAAAAPGAPRARHAPATARAPRCRVRVAARRPIGQHRERPMGQAGGELQPPVRRPVVGRGECRQAAHQQTGDQPAKVTASRAICAHGGSSARQIEQRGADEHAGHAKRRATAPARSARTGWRGGPGRGGRPAGAAVRSIVSAGRDSFQPMWNEFVAPQVGVARARADHRPVAAVDHHLGRATGARCRLELITEP